MLRDLFNSFNKDDKGQDLSEYCLLTALIALIGLAIFIHLSGGVQNIWSGTGSTLATANDAATSAGTGAATASNPAGPSH